MCLSQNKKYAYFSLGHKVLENDKLKLTKLCASRVDKTFLGCQEKKTDIFFVSLRQCAVKI